MNWKYFATVGIEKEFSPIGNQDIYYVYVSNDFEKSSEVVSIGDDYDVINKVSFTPKAVGKIRGREFVVIDTTYLNFDSFIVQILISVLKNFQVEKVKPVAQLTEQVKELLTSAGFQLIEGGK